MAPVFTQTVIVDWIFREMSSEHNDWLAQQLNYKINYQTALQYIATVAKSVPSVWKVNKYQGPTRKGQGDSKKQYWGKYLRDFQ